MPVEMALQVTLLQVQRAFEDGEQEDVQPFERPVILPRRLGEPVDLRRQNVGLVGISRLGIGEIGVVARHVEPTEAEGFAPVGRRHAADRCRHEVAPERQVAPVLAVRGADIFRFRGFRQVKERRQPILGFAHQRVRHAVSGNRQEADGLDRVRDVARDALARGNAALRETGNVDQRDADAHLVPPSTAPGCGRCRRARPGRHRAAFRRSGRHPRSARLSTPSRSGRQIASTDMPPGGS